RFSRDWSSDVCSSDLGAGHLLEVDITLEELATIMAEELELPRIQPKGQASIVEEKAKYNSIRQTGPESLRHFKRTYLRALRRQRSEERRVAKEWRSGS